MAQKTAYLTIDDAPSPAMAWKAEYLLSKAIPAVFFCVGKFLEQYPDLAVDVIHKGFILGNHSYDHPHFSDLTLEQAFEQIEHTDATLNWLYERAGVERPARFFRFPYGDKGGLKYSEVFEPYEPEGAVRKAALQEFLRRTGHIKPCFPGVTYRYYLEAGLREDVDWYWTYDVMEWTIFLETHYQGIDSPEKVYARMDENEPENGRGLNDTASEEIILLHDMPQTDEIFVPIVERLIKKGLQFKLPDWKS